MKLWFTPSELAGLALPGLPASKRAMNRLAEADGWKHRVAVDTYERLARKRTGRQGGGGWEYHISIVTEGLEPQRLIIAEASLDDVEQAEELHRVDKAALLLCLDPEEMAVINRLARRAGIPADLMAKQLLKKSIALVQVAE